MSTCRRRWACTCWQDLKIRLCAVSILVAGLGLGQSFQPVVRDWLPGRGVVDEGAPSGPHAWVAVECAHPYADIGRILGAATEQVRSAIAAEALFVAAIRMAPALEQLFSLEHPQRMHVNSSLYGGGRTGSTLATRAMTIAGVSWRFGEFKADGTTQASAGQGWSTHRVCECCWEFWMEPGAIV